MTTVRRPALDRAAILIDTRQVGFRDVAVDPVPWWTAIGIAEADIDENSGHTWVRERTSAVGSFSHLSELVLRIWDVSPSILCRAHLLGEHRELHAIWAVLTQEKQGYARHPETLRWRGKLAALALRHDSLVAEMTRRGYNHASPLDPSLATGSSVQDEFIDSPERQLELLHAKGCDCSV